MSDGMSDARGMVYLYCDNSRRSFRVHKRSVASDNLARVESLRWRLRLQLLRIWDKLEALAVQLLDLGGEAHARNENGEQLLYRAERSPSEESPGWVTWFLDRRDPGSEPHHVELGQAIHDLSTFAFRDNGKRRQIAEAALEHCLQDLLKHQTKKHNRVARIPVNGRDYWYRCEINHSGYSVWERWLWPEDDTVVIEARS